MTTIAPEIIAAREAQQVALEALRSEIYFFLDSHEPGTPEYRDPKIKAAFDAHSESMLRLFVAERVYGQTNNLARREARAQQGGLHHE